MLYTSNFPFTCLESEQAPLICLKNRVFSVTARREAKQFHNSHFMKDIISQLLSIHALIELLFYQTNPLHLS